MVPLMCVCNCDLYCNVACWPFSYACADPAAPLGNFCAGCGLTYLLRLSGGTLRQLWHGVSVREKDFDGALIVLVRLHPWASFARSVFLIKDFD
jgi:hypothetical protein